MTITESAYIAALEKKLMEAERALYGFRAIWNNLQTNGLGNDRHEESAGRCSLSTTREDGLYDGQLSYPNDLEECED